MTIEQVCKGSDLKKRIEYFEKRILAIESGRTELAINFPEDEPLNLSCWVGNENNPSLMQWEKDSIAFMKKVKDNYESQLQILKKQLEDL